MSAYAIMRGHATCRHRADGCGSRDAHEGGGAGSTEQRLAFRARAILNLAVGLSNQETARRTATRLATVSKWQANCPSGPAKAGAQRSGCEVPGVYEGPNLAMEKAIINDRDVQPEGGSMRRMNWLVLLLLLTTTAGCQTLHSGGAPKPSFNVDDDLKELAKEYGEPVSISKFYEAPTKAGRDKFITGRLVMMNIRYIQFIRDSTSERQLLDSAVDILAISLNLAGAAVSSAGTKTVLAAIAAGVTGSKAVIDKNFYYEKTVPALIAAMNAQRKKVFVEILTGTTKPLEVYPFPQAVTDLHNYYLAGTYLGAIQAIQSDSGLKEAQQDTKLDKVRGRLSSPLSPEMEELKGSLSDAVDNLQESDLDKAKVALTQLGVTDAPADLGTAQDKLKKEVRATNEDSQVARVAKAFREAKIIQ